MGKEWQKIYADFIKALNSWEKSEREKIKAVKELKNNHNELMMRIFKSTKDYDIKRYIIK